MQLSREMHRGLRLQVWNGSDAGLLGQVLGSSQLAHASAEAVFKCYLFRRSSMSQRLILRGLHSAALSHAEKADAPDMYKASFAAAKKHQQVTNKFSCALIL